ncbi:UDP-N-acetylmuramyl-tripeptide synthetase [uncultured Sphaerochaeta sp.]|uniref:Mur ligase family protein n=1 Tax=uncultured Sphaerochaeta sp. TaxID=886478 RepID=UPI002A0A2F9C|nr:UDP-N-acetylmuramyl-tripeptide synthetase [uncultured Sphaerochaeta sp.]
MKQLFGLLDAVGLPLPAQSADIFLSELCYDSRQCKKACAFFAFEGIHTDGQQYIAQAIDNGAICIFSTKEQEIKQKGILYITTPHPRSLFSRMCAAFYEYPAKGLCLIGVTGTDGKSTTCDYLYQLLQSQGLRTGLLGTISMDDGSSKQPSPYRQSTPEADSLQQFLRRCVDNGLSYVILECTSHALSKEYDRLATLAYDLAIVTTVTSEHLEFHKTLEAYLDAKCNLIRNLKPGGLFISTTDNPCLETFLSCLGAKSKATILHRDHSCSIGLPRDGRIECTLDGRQLSLPVLLPCLASNALLAALGACAILKTSLESLIPSLQNLQPVQGRMISIPNSLKLQIIMDFAHTADGYEKLFSGLPRIQATGRIIAVFGCAGERDTSKRGPMGKIAATYAQILILTEEDPRQEGNEKIFADLLEQIPAEKSKDLLIEQIPDRTQAIERAFALAQPKDTLLFLGKGHEHTIEGPKGKRPWNEEEEIKKVLTTIQNKQGDGHTCI